MLKSKEYFIIPILPFSIFQNVKCIQHWELSPQDNLSIMKMLQMFELAIEHPIALVCKKNLKEKSYIFLIYLKEFYEY